MTFQLLSTGNPKTLKSEKQGYLTYILHLSPANYAGVGNMCPKATAGCEAACLNTAGHGGMFKPGMTTNHVQEARKRKTHWFASDRPAFLEALRSDITKAIKQAAKKNMTPVFRLNGTSDLRWELMDVIQRFPTIQFYDYTKIANRRVAHLPNYHLTFSQADGNEADVRRAIAAGMNVATVFRKALPATHMGLPVYNGDDSDLRFLDPAGVVVGLKAKGKAKKDTTGFVVDPVI